MTTQFILTHMHTQGLFKHLCISLEAGESHSLLEKAHRGVRRWYEQDRHPIWEPFSLFLLLLSIVPTPVVLHPITMRIVTLVLFFPTVCFGAIPAMLLAYCAFRASEPNGFGRLHEMLRIESGSVTGKPNSLHAILSLGPI